MSEIDVSRGSLQLLGNSLSPSFKSIFLFSYTDVFLSGVKYEETVISGTLIHFNTATVSYSIQTTPLIPQGAISQENQTHQGAQMWNKTIDNPQG